MKLAIIICLAISVVLVRFIIAQRQVYRVTSCDNDWTQEEFDLSTENADKILVWDDGYRLVIYTKED